MCTTGDAAGILTTGEGGPPFHARIVLGRPFPRGMAGLQLGKYSLTALPAPAMGPFESVVQFPVHLFQSEDSIASAHPSAEAAILCDFLSLCTHAHVRVSVGTPAGLEHADGLTSKTKGTRQIEAIDGSSTVRMYDQALRLDPHLAEQTVRAARAFNTALSLGETDVTLASVMLVLAGECLSSQRAVIANEEIPLDHKADRFSSFVQTWGSEEAFLPLTPKTDLAREVLKTAYHLHRSAFLHGGSEVAEAIELADQLGRAYVRHTIDGKARPSPGLSWLAKVVRSAIAEFVLNCKATGPVDEHLIARIARPRSSLRLKAKRAIAKGEFVGLDDVDLD